MALGLTVHIEGPELGLYEELEGGEEVVEEISLEGCLTNMHLFINGPRSNRPHRWS